MYNELKPKHYLMLIKNNLKFLLSITLIITIVSYLGWFLLNNDGDVEEQEILEEVEVGNNQVLLEQDFSDLTEVEKSQLQDFIESEAYYFRIYIEGDEQEPFTNYLLFKEIISSDSIVEEIEEIAGEEFLPRASRAIIVSIDGNSNIMTIQIGTGDSDRNLELANATIDYLNENNIEYFEDKEIFIIDEQPTQVSSTEDIESNFEANEPQPNYSMNDFVLLALVPILGFISAFILLLIKISLSSKTSVIYEFKNLEKDKVIDLTRLNKREQIVTLNTIIDQYDSENKLLLSDLDFENDPEAHFIGDIKYKITEDPKITQLSNLIFIVIPGETSKVWYDSQRQILDNESIDTTIVKIS